MSMMKDVPPQNGSLDPVDVVRMRDQQGLSFKEIGNRLGAHYLKVASVYRREKGLATKRGGARKSPYDGPSTPKGVLSEIRRLLMNIERKDQRELVKKGFADIYAEVSRELEDVDKFKAMFDKLTPDQKSALKRSLS
jgi:hypothetical protein